MGPTFVTLLNGALYGSRGPTFVTLPDGADRAARMELSVSFIQNKSRFYPRLLTGGRGEYLRVVGILVMVE